MQTDVTELIERACLGEQRAVVEIIDLFYRNIYAFLRRLTSNDADAADLTQRTFSRVWQALPTFAGRSSVSSWIHSIAYHTYVDWRRVAGRMETQPSEWWADRACLEPGPDERAVRNDLASVLYACVDELAPELRETVHLHYYQELTLQETAEAMGVATSTVKYRLRQALSELGNKMQPGRVLAAASTTSAHL
jgi:RNA polymerase sigma factor (sigma-70 family)